MPPTMPPWYLSSTFHRLKNRVSLRMDVSFGCGEVAVTREVGESVRVHVRSPVGQTSMSEGVKRERRDLCEFANLHMLLSQTRLLDVASFCGSREQPLSSRCRSAHLDHCRHARSHRNHTMSFFCLAVENVNRAFPNLGPSQPKAL